MTQFFNLALQRLHLGLQRVDLVDQFDIALRAAVTLRLLLERGDAFGQTHALRICGCRESNGGHEGRRYGFTY